MQLHGAHAHVQSLQKSGMICVHTLQRRGGSERDIGDTYFTFN